MRVTSGKGVKYSSLAIVEEEIVDPNNLDLNGQPGMRVPHLWVEYQGHQCSTVDLAVSHFVLLAGPEGEEWCDAAGLVAAHLGVDLKAYHIAPDSDLRDPKGR